MQRLDGYLSFLQDLCNMRTAMRACMTEALTSREVSPALSPSHFAHTRICTADTAMLGAVTLTVPMLCAATLPVSSCFSWLHPTAGMKIGVVCTRTLFECRPVCA